MNDNDVIAKVIALLQAGLQPTLPNILVLQNYQPTQQGVPEVPVLYLHKIQATRYGWQNAKSTFNEIDEDFDTSEKVWRTPAFQVSGLAQQDPANPGLTASDIVELAAGVMNSAQTVANLMNDGIGILKITDVRLNYFSNDKRRFEQEPSFDFVLSYNSEILTYKTPQVSSIEGEGGPILEQGS